MRMLPAIVLTSVLCGALVASEKDDELLAAARAADLEYQRSLSLTVDRLSSPWSWDRIDAMRTLGHLRDPEVAPHLLAFLDTAKHDKDEVLAAVQALCDSGGALAAARIQPLLLEKDAEIRTATLNALTRLKTIGAADYTQDSRDSYAPNRASSLTNLGTLAHGDAIDILLKALGTDSRPHIRRMCAIGIGKIGTASSGPQLVDALSDADPGVRRYAAEAIAKINYTNGIPALLMAMECNIASQYLNRAVMQLSGQDFGFDPFANALERTAAIDKGFVWWAANAPKLGR
jgi:HEAT repeat protein